jgi:hypothetical protein
VTRVRWLVAASLLVSAIGFAQPPGATPPQQAAGPVDPAAPPAQQKLERIKKRIRALRAYTLTEELQLDGPTAGKLFPLLARYDEEFDKLLVERAGLQNRLGKTANGSDANAANKIIDDALANQRAFWQVEDKRLDEIRKILSPQQTAKLLVVLPPLERKIENQLRQAVQAGKARRPANDDADDDEVPAAPSHPPRRASPPE